MRTPADLPRRRPGTRGRVILIAAVALLFVGLTSLRGLASFWTTYLWFGELHLTSVWRGVLGAKVLLGALFTLVFFALLFVNLLIADRMAPRFRMLGVADDELVQRYRAMLGGHSGKVRVAVSVLFALLAGTGASSEWHNWLLFRNAVDFPTKDPQFHKNVSWFVFKLPFLQFLVNWWFQALVITLVVTLVAHYLNGGIRLQASGQRVASFVKAHVSVLLGGLALVKAVGYWLQRYELDFSTRGFRHGAGYTDVKAQLPALQLLVVISLFAAALFVYNIGRRGWGLPVIGVGLWLFISIVVGAVYPAFIQKFRVEPSENTRERPYIERNIKATRDAMGISGVESLPYNYNTNLTPADLANDADTIRNVRLWDPSIPDISKTYQRLQEIRSYYVFNDIDIDRYQLDGKTTQAIVSARELNTDDLPSQSWVNRRLQFTHGYGAILSPANAVTGDGKPEFLVKDVPPQGEPKITEPRIYYSERTGGYAIVNTDQKELDFQDATGRSESSRYQGSGGVPMGSVFRRAAFAMRFGDTNPLISGLVHSRSRAIYIRDIGERVRTAAPFLRYDADPYMVLINGRIQWVQDAYTVTSRYPYAQRADTDRVSAASGLNSTFNYVRNSVKVVIDAYNGSMKFYVIDQKDPLIKAYVKAFPKLFTPGSQMPDELRQHLRYPEDLFRVQTNMYGRYHITDPNDFYNAADAWNISQDPGSGDPAAALQTTATTNAQGVQIGRSRTKRMDPAYLLMRLPNEKDTSFLILQPFVPVSQGDKQQNLASFMTAKSDPGDYGKLQVFVMPRNGFVDGPALVNARVSSNTNISKEISLLNTQGSQVLLGNVVVVPIQQSLLYIRPLYVQSSQNPLPELRKVIVVYGDRSEMGDSLQEVLTRIFGAAPPTLEERKGGTTTTPAPTTAAPDVKALLDQAQAAYAAAQAALKAGDLAEYQRQINVMADLLGKARVAADKGAGSSSTTTTTAPSSA